MNQNYINPLIAPLQPAQMAAKAAIYGIGINSAIVKLSVQGDIKEVYNDYEGKVATDPYHQYNPDAFPNKNGGYDTTSRWDGKMASSLLGMPVMCHLRFIGGSYIDIEGVQQSFPDIDFETVLITATQGRNIKKTSINGRNTGSVKEYIGNEDWTIDIRVIITSDAPLNSEIQRVHQDGVYPVENMEALWKLLKAPVAIPIECMYLNRFDINYLVVDDGVTIEQVEGQYSQQRVIIPCVSDNPLIIEFVE